ncbi:uncharacterized protein LOC131306749 [Rhododendron vialii]|uniref:uncharacterized protein LOC131306749 n=1 Tax=Rhododendron vialii TaxID=182163 RepID=UPI00265F9EC0|nr:uncharacterized protein LOC131306749 [Rhododendron vialii]
MVIKATCYSLYMFQKHAFHVNATPVSDQDYNYVMLHYMKGERERERERERGHMEAHNERKEQVEKEERERMMKKEEERGEEVHSKMPEDPATKAKEVIREAIVSGGDDQRDDQEEDKAREPDDVLVFSRAVNKVDSSLE